MTWRRLLFVCHRYCGLAAAFFLLVAGVTGCLLVFRAELDVALNPDLFRVANRPALAATEVARCLQQAHPGWRITGFELRARPGRALRFTVEPLPAGEPDVTVPGADEVLVDPSDPRVTGMRARRIGLDRRHLFRTIYLLHYTLLAGTAGRWTMGLVALLWLVLNLLGVCMTWPRTRPRLVNWMPAWLTSRRRLARRPMPEIHRVGGLWTAALLTMLAYTSVAMNFYDALFRPLVEMVSPPRRSPLDAETIRPGLIPSQPEADFAAAVRIAVAAAARQTPGFAPVALTDDIRHGVVGVSFAAGGSVLYEGFGRVTYQIDRRTGQLVWIDQPRRDGPGRLVLRSLYPLHSGQVGGLVTRLLVLFLGVVTCKLAVTGFLPWWRRRAGSRALLKGLLK